MNTVLKSLVIGTAPAMVMAGTLMADVSAANSKPLDAPASQPSTQPSVPSNPAPSVPPPTVIVGIRG